MGKSTVAKMFAEEGVPVFDADAVVHRLYAPGSPLIDRIEHEFPGTTDANGVDRAALAAAVLGDPGKLARLEAITHPAVADARTAFLTDHPEAPLVVLDVPLLFEAGGWSAVDQIAVVSAPEPIQRARVLARPGMTPDRFDSLRARQLPDAEKRARAHFVIPTGGTFEETRAEVRRVIACLVRNGVG